MTDEPKQTIHIDIATQREDLPDRCPDFCPICNTPAEHGFGMAGGGMGVYIYCLKCEVMLGKVQTDD